MKVLPILLSKETALEILRGHRTSIRKVVKPKYGKVNYPPLSLTA